MKRIIIAFCLNVFMLSCSNSAQWSEQEIYDFKQHLKSVSSLDYLKAMSEKELEDLTIDLAKAIRVHNPKYQQFIELPSAKDTITTYVISFMSYYLDSGARTLRSLYPYRDLVREGILPTGMSDSSKAAFYLCLENKLRARYKSMEFFLGALSYGQGAATQAQEYIKECAAEF